ncbi:MAG TPA: hypothetical protein VIY86_03310, partial [Pirellulaceae bacterium]
MLSVVGGDNLWPHIYLRRGILMRTVPLRSAVAIDDTWDLKRLYADESAWDRDFARFDREIKKYAKFQGELGSGTETLVQCLKLDSSVSRLAERLGAFAFLRAAEDQANSQAQRMLGRFQASA